MSHVKMEQHDLADVLGRIIISRGDIQDVGEAFAEELGKLMDIDWAVIALFDKTVDGEVTLQPFASRVDSRWDPMDSMTLLKASMDKVVKNRGAVVDSDLKKQGTFWAASALVRQGICSLVYLPLFSRSEVVGSLIVGSKRANAYKARELTLLRFAAIQLAMPVQINGLIKEIGRRDEQLAEMKQSGAMVQEAQSEVTVVEEIKEPVEEQVVAPYDEIIERVEEEPADLVAESRNIVEEHFAALFEEARRSAEENQERVQQYYDAVLEETRKSVEESEGKVQQYYGALFEQAGKDAEVHFNTLVQDGRNAAEAQRIEVNERYAMLVNESKKNMEEDRSNQKERFNALVNDARKGLEDDRNRAKEQFLALVASAEACALQSSKPVLDEEQGFVNNLVGIVACGATIAETLDSFAAQLRTRVKFDHLSLAMIHGEGLRIHCATPEDMSPKAGEVYPVRDCAAAWIMEHMSTSVEGDLMMERKFPIDELHLKHGIRSVIRLPLVSPRGLFGTLNLASCEPNAYGSEEQKLLEELVTRLAPCLERICLQTREKERLEFLNATIHEVRTPLTSILSSSKLLKEETKSDAEGLQARLVANVVQSAERMGSRVSQFFDLAKIQGPDFKLETEVTDIRPVLEESTLRIIPSAQSRGQLIFMELPESLPQVKINVTRFEQALLTLLSNLSILTPEAGKISLRARQQDGKLVVEVQSSRVTFSAEEVDHLLKPYHMTEASRETFSDVRLALALVRNLVELHGGSLWMESNEEDGTTVAFSLPPYS